LSKKPITQTAHKNELTHRKNITQEPKTRVQITQRDRPDANNFLNKTMQTNKNSTNIFEV